MTTLSDLLLERGGGAPVSVLEQGVRRARAQIQVGRRDDPLDAPEPWEPWVRELFPRHVDSFAPRHREVWDWGWEIDGPDDTIDPFCAIWPRGGGKSTTAELVTAGLGLRGRRRYAWYIRETQLQANDSLKNIAALLESETVERYYPDHAQRRLTKYGHSKGWNSERLSTAGGFTVDAIGLDTAARGLKVEEVRPDLIVIDDIDGLHDSMEATKKKLATLQKTVLPAGTSRTAVLAIQNLIIPHGVFSQLADGRTDMLALRRLSGPHPAIERLETEVREDDSGRRRTLITGGVPTWEGQGLAECQQLVDLIGIKAFLQECQHQVKHRPGALWNPDVFRYVTDVPPLLRVVVGVDPSGGGDEIGILVAGMTHDRRYVVLADVTQKGAAGPLNWGNRAVTAYDDHEADRVVAERNFGGDMVASNILVAAEGRRVPVEMVTASRGKMIRAEPVAALYEDGLVDHVPGLVALETELTTWVPGDKWSPNRLDALVWALSELALTKRRRVMAWYPGMEEVA